MAFEITNAELASVDEDELAFLYKRIAAKLASGRQAWVYVHGHGTTDRYELSEASVFVDRSRDWSK